MPPKHDARDSVVSALINDGWTVRDEACALPFSLVDGYRDDLASAFVVAKGPDKVIIVVKPVAHPVEFVAIARKIIERHAQFAPSAGDIETEVVIDESRGHFALGRSGWVNGCRIHGNVIHIDIRGDKIWIQHDGTEFGVANELIAAGVPKEHIVLAFNPPEMRKYTDFAVA